MPKPNFLVGQRADGQSCDTLVSEALFGICDDASKRDEPAYISTDQTAENTWIARVDNSPEYDVTFTAVDKCIPVFKGSGGEQKRCDGLLQYETTLIFVELKEHKDPGKQWANEAANQIKQTMSDFADAHGFSGKTIRAHIANRVQPNAQQGHASVIKNFFSATKLILRIEGTIVL
ncbi:hypothetical protein HNQ93_004217 [Hymenobacter luteus]|uniref:Uncharacterized protein n=2 Tax=Hymenobacter TaxID=89966 RepID=A0A7W9T5U8_9BACT|nr:MULTISPECIES: hypothetical protein [Hymenobacter]MBB4603590.1 hypothetical protein [Hymenobacter latericoloratus]MBB6061338.1 hypothetical protein [Hymenobacter luteus]